MRIAFVSTSFPRSTNDHTSIFLERFAHALKGRGNEVTVLVPLDGNEPSREFRNGIEIIRVNYPRLFSHALAYGSGMASNFRKRPWLALQAPGLVLSLALAMWRVRGRVDVFHAHWVLAGVAAWTIRKLTGKPYLLTIHGSDISILRSRVCAMLLKPVLNAASSCMVVSKVFQNDISAIYGLSSEKLILAPMGVEMARRPQEEAQRYFDAKNLSSGGPFLLSAAAIIEAKGIHFLIQLIAHNELKHFHLMLCGKTEDSPYLIRLNKLAAALNCAERVHFVGPVAPAEMSFFFSLADCYVSASLAEGKPVAVLEACQSQVPVVISDIDAHREIIEHGESGFLFSQGHLERAVRSILELESPALRQKVTANAKKYADQYSWERCAQLYIRHYERALAK